MLGSLIGAFLFSIILLGVFQVLGLRTLSDDRDLSRFSKIVAVVCLVMWALRGFGLSTLFSQIGTWAGFTAAAWLLVHLNRRGALPRR